MRIIVAVSGDSVASHFGHCDTLKAFDVDGQTITGTQDITPPVHQPGVLPAFIADQGAECIIAGGMGDRAQQMFLQKGIIVISGISGDPDEAIKKYLEGTLTAGENACDH